MLAMRSVAVNVCMTLFALGLHHVVCSLIWGQEVGAKPDSLDEQTSCLFISVNRVDQKEQCLSGEQATPMVMKIKHWPIARATILRRFIFRLRIRIRLNRRNDEMFDMIIS